MQRAQLQINDLALTDAKGKFSMSEVQAGLNWARDESATASTISMTGFAGNPGTDVDPACSRRSTPSPSAPRILSASRAKSSGQRGS